MDFTCHNTDQAAVWAAFNAGTPTRVPVTISCNPRMIILDPALNTTGITFQQCFDDPQVMFDLDLRFQYWLRHEMPCDIERGLPEEWVITPGFYNTNEAAWLGADIHYIEGEVPDTRPFLTDDNKRMLLDRGIPDPFAGAAGKLRDYYEYYRERAARETFYDRPITVGTPWAAVGTDGPFTVACNVRGATEFCLDIYEDPEYADEMLAFMTEAAIVRRRAWRKYLGLPQEMDGYGIADDSIVLLSCDAYRELILPHHKTLYTTDVKPGSPCAMHLCGDASRHFVTIRDELGVASFDTGYPIDHGKLRRELGPDITIMGGPHVDLLLHGTPEEVAAETRRILHSGVMEGGRFILKEANNLAPRTPMANIQAMYDTCILEGVYAGATA